MPQVKLPFTNQSVLKWALAPHDVDTFIADVWEKKALHIPHEVSLSLSLSLSFSLSFSFSLHLRDLDDVPFILFCAWLLGVHPHIHMVL